MRPAGGLPRGLRGGLGRLGCLPEGQDAPEMRVAERVAQRDSGGWGG